MLVNDQRTTKEMITGSLSPSLAHESTRPERVRIVVEVVDYDVDQLRSKRAVHGCVEPKRWPGVSEFHLLYLVEGQVYEL
jgi:hypothetical protein